MTDTYLHYDESNCEIFCKKTSCKCSNPIPKYKEGIEFEFDKHKWWWYSTDERKKQMLQDDKIELENNNKIINEQEQFMRKQELENHIKKIKDNMCSENKDFVDFYEYLKAQGIEHDKIMLSWEKVKITKAVIQHRKDDRGDKNGYKNNTDNN
jgi:hypothetical protein